MSVGQSAFASHAGALTPAVGEGLLGGLSARTQGGSPGPFAPEGEVSGSNADASTYYARGELALQAVGPRLYSGGVWSLIGLL